jgi:predicted ATPase/DNA-binding XRE family transcriptional regulator
VASFGELLRQYRVAHGFSQETLAELARLSTSAIGALERGSRRAPYRESVALLADALQLSALERTEFEGAADRGRGRASRVPESTAPANNLPVALTSFVGRDEELVAIKILLRQHRLVTVTGSGGAGKTRIALEVAGELLADDAREMWFVDLSRLTNGTFVANTVAELLDVSIGESADPVHSLVMMLKARNMVLILDNCEHVIDDVAALARALLQACPNISILATSRERLALQGEHLYRLPALAMPSSLQLFADRANAAGARFDFAEESLRMVTSVCRRLEGIPLAVELAASHAPALGLVTLDARLAAHLDLTGRARDLPQRQQTMLATVAWSYNLLSDSERHLLRRMSVFRGGTSYDAAQAIGEGAVAAASIPNLLSMLVEKSLLNSASTEIATRFTMLETVRAFALQELTASGEFAAAARAQALWLATFAERAEQRYRSEPSNSWLKEVAPEVDNARSVFEWVLSDESEDDVLIAARILCGMYRYWLHTVRFQELRGWALAVLARINVERYPRIVSRLIRVQLYYAHGSERVAIAERSMPLLEEHFDRGELIDLHVFTAFEYQVRGEYDVAEQKLARAFALAKQPPAPHTQVLINIAANRSNLRLHSGRIAEARADLAEAQRLAGLLVVNPNTTIFLTHLEGCIEFAERRMERAAAAFEAAASLERAQSGNAAFVLCDLASVRLELGDVDAAFAAIREALEALRDVPDYAWIAIWHLAAIAAIRGRHEKAVRLIGFSRAEFIRRDRLTDEIQRASEKHLAGAIAPHLTTTKIADFEAFGASLTASQALTEAFALVAEIEAATPRG